MLPCLNLLSLGDQLERSGLQGATCGCASSVLEVPAGVRVIAMGTPRVVEGTRLLAFFLKMFTTIVSEAISWCPSFPPALWS